MVEPAIVNNVRDYLRRVRQLGIQARSAVLFGSQIKQTARETSDIDLVVLAPEFDRSHDAQLVKKLWSATSVDWRIEPIPCGVVEWTTCQNRPILEIARAEGVLIED